MACNNDDGECRGDYKCSKTYDKSKGSATLHFSTTHFTIPNADIEQSTEGVVEEETLSSTYT